MRPVHDLFSLRVLTRDSGEISMGIKIVKKQLWRFKKKSLSEPFKFAGCGCKAYIYDSTIVRHCSDHMPGSFGNIFASLKDLPMKEKNP
jgi:hypothetical protein